MFVPRNACAMGHEKVDCMAISGVLYDWQHMDQEEHLKV